MLGLGEIEFENTAVVFVCPQCPEQQYRKLRFI